MARQLYYQLTVAITDNIVHQSVSIFTAYLSPGRDWIHISSPLENIIGMSRALPRILSVQKVERTLAIMPHSVIWCSCRTPRTESWMWFFATPSIPKASFAGLQAREPISGIALLYPRRSRVSIVDPWESFLSSCTVYTVGRFNRQTLSRSICGNGTAPSCIMMVYSACRAAQGR